MTPREMITKLAVGAMLCLTLLSTPGAGQRTQAKARPPSDFPAEGKQTGVETTAKHDSDSTITIDIKVSAEGIETLPQGSTIELKGDDESCKDLRRPEEPIGPDGEVAFSDLPVCKVKLSIFITGFDFKTTVVDLAKYKGPIQIRVKVNGPPEVK